MATNRQRAGWMVIAVSIVGGFEGIRTVAYMDPVGIPTACFGETKNVRLGQKFTMAECESMLIESLGQADDAVRRCVKVPMSDARHAALVSFTYNVGGAAFCNSTLVRKLNAGDIVGGCDQLLRWDKAKGVRLPGLTKRRAEERKLCLQGLT